MDNNEKTIHKLIKEICIKRNIKVKKLSYDWILELSKGDQIKHIVGNFFDINNEGAGKIACDKYATYEVLKSKDVPVIEHEILFDPLTRSSYIDENGTFKKAIDYFNNYKKVVIKPNNGYKGQGVYLCENLKQLEVAISKLFKTNSSISICPYYDIDMEYRTFYLDGNCYLVYGKTKPFVIGDGVSTVGELIGNSAMYLPDNNVVNENLSNIDLDYVPKENEKYFISWKHNLSGGATPKIITDEALKERIFDLVKKAGKASNITFATIDVIKTTDNKMYVLEINSGVCMTKFIEQVENGYDIAKDIYSKAIDYMFKK